MSFVKQQGRRCSLCGSPGATKATCPANPSAKNPNFAKHPNAEKAFVSAAPAPKAVSKAKAPKSAPKAEPMVKVVTTKGHGPTDRLAAGPYYRKYGEAAVGQICDIRGNGDLRCLLLDKNGRPRWAKVSKSSKGQEACGIPPWVPSCQEKLY